MKSTQHYLTPQDRATRKAERIDIISGTLGCSTFIWAILVFIYKVLESAPTH